MVVYAIEFCGDLYSIYRTEQSAIDGFCRDYDATYIGRISWYDQIKRSLPDLGPEGDYDDVEDYYEFVRNGTDDRAVINITEYEVKG